MNRSDTGMTDNTVVIESRNRTASFAILLFGIGLLVAAQLPGRGSRVAEVIAGAQFSHCLDPNVATWYELAQLPAIGESVARRIVEYRDRPDLPRPVFKGAGDLGRVRGIGPKTAGRIAEYLRFPPN